MTIIRASVPRWLVFLVTCCLGSSIGCYRLEKSLNRGLEGEKSYTRHAMEYHREHPEKRRGDRVLEVWSQADYIAQDAAQQHTSGTWAKTSDDLQFIPNDLKRYDAKPFCVIHKAEFIEVIWYVRGAQRCDTEGDFNAEVSRINSGDMEFSGRTDYWVYVLRQSPRQ